MGVHKPEEIEEFGKHDLKVLSDMLADKPFFFGDEPTTLDVVSFAVLSQLHFISKDVNLPLRDFIPEAKEGKEGETEKKTEQESAETEKIEKELEKDKSDEKTEKVEENKEKEESK
uniref:Metaxin glutathione S-transferase domain-containing protein n=1 Tax=Phlebotomus papatasi TaxID=29031 RepID=A0A1B0DJG8_PHLPP